MLLHDIKLFENSVVESFDYLWQVRLAFDTFEQFYLVLSKHEILFFIDGHYLDD